MKRNTVKVLVMLQLLVKKNNRLEVVLGKEVSVPWVEHLEFLGVKKLLRLRLKLQLGQPELEVEVTVVGSPQ